MRVMVLVKASENSEAGVMPTTEEFAAMGAYNEQLVDAGIMLAGDGLKPTSAGARVRFDGSGDNVVLDGPFTETKELVAGFWIWEVASLEEAVEWLKKAPFTAGDVVEVRPVFGPEDFGDSFTPELVEQENQLRARTGQA